MSHRMRLAIVLAAMVIGILGGDAMTQASCDVCIRRTPQADTGSSTTTSGTTLKRGGFAVGFTFEHRKWDELGHRNAHELHEEGRHVHNFDHDEFYQFAASYGMTDDLEVGLTVPLVKKTFLRVEDGVVGKGDDSFGIGDLAFLTKWRVHRGVVDWALLGQVKFPTGETAERGFDGKKLEPEEVAGSGSFDYALGTAIGKQIGRWTVNGDLIYTFKTEGHNGYEFGDTLRFDLGTSVRLMKEERFPSVRLTSEINVHLAKRDRDREGNKVFDSGGVVFFLTPGISVDLNRETTMFFLTPIPIFQDWGGEHNELKYGLIAGISFRTR